MPLTWIAFLGASIITVLCLRWIFGKETSNLFSDYLFTFILVWKFSVILTDFKVLLQSPWTLLYFNGGSIGVICGFIAVILHIVYHRYRKKIEMQQLYTLSIGLIQLQSFIRIILVTMQDETMIARVVTYLGFGIIIFLTVRFKNEMVQMIREMHIIYVTALLFLSAWQQESIWQMSVLYGLIIAVVWVVFFTYDEKKQTEGNH